MKLATLSVALSRVLLVLLLCGNVIAFADPSPKSFGQLSRAEQERRASDFLRQSSSPFTGQDVFTLDKGLAPYPDGKYAAYLAVLRRPDAAAVFEKLLTSRSAATQLYALTGLSKRAPMVFRKVAPRYLGRKDNVPMLTGCEGFSRPLGDAVRDLLAGRSPASPTRLPPR